MPRRMSALQFLVDDNNDDDAATTLRHVLCRHWRWRVIGAVNTSRKKYGRLGGSVLQLLLLPLPISDDDSTSPSIISVVGILVELWIGVLCEVVRRRTSVHVEDGRSSVHVEVLRLYTWKNTWKINLAGNGDFGGQLVPFPWFVASSKASLGIFA